MFSPGLYIVLFLTFFLVTGFIISVLFFFQRKTWQRMVSCLCGLDFLFLCVTNNLPRYGNYHEIKEVHKLYLELAGFLWMIIILLLPRKKEATSSSNPARNEKEISFNVNATVVIFLIQFLFKMQSISGDIESLFADKWEHAYAIAGMLMLLLFLAGIILFYLRKNTGYVLLVSYCVYAAFSELAYISWLLYEQQTQALYQLKISEFSYIRLSYYCTCIYFLFRKDFLSFINVDKRLIAIAFILSGVLASVLFWNYYLS